MHRLTFVALALPFMAACQPATTELTEEQWTVIADEFRQHRMDMYAAAERLDADGVMRSFAADAVLIGQGVRMTYEDYDAIVRNLFGSVQSQSIDVLDMWVDVLAADAVANTDVIAVAVTDSAGNVVEQTYLHTEVWVKRDDRWVMIHGQQALAAEPMQDH
jgi:hypothetical protein